MLTEPELTGLLYRADWTQLSLSAGLTITTDHGDERLPGSWPGIRGPRPPWVGPGRPSGRPADGPYRVTGRLLVAPGRRYRLETTGEDGRRCLEGCDGDRPWHQLSQPEDGSHIQIFGDPQPPEPELLHPSWLLTGFDLGLADAAVVGGREGYRVVATPRSSSPGADSVAQRRSGQVEVVVDAELGILLRCEKISGGQVQRVSELHDVVLGPPEAAAPAQFAAPPESIISESGPSLGTAFGPAAKTAGGLGAVILASAIRRAGRRATRAEPGETIPHQEGEAVWATPAADGPPLGDDLVYRLYRAGHPAPAFTAEYHQWLDPAVLAEMARSGSGAWLRWRRRSEK